MKFETKFNIGDSVYIVHTSREPTRIPCTKCNGEIKVVDGYEYVCTFCKNACYTGKFADGSPVEIWHEKTSICIPYQHNWDNGVPGKKTHTIGKINVEFTGKNYDRYNKECGKVIVRYMCVETGVGSGTLWKEEDCFASEEEALEECGRRNVNTKQIKP